MASPAIRADDTVLMEPTEQPRPCAKNIRAAILLLPPDVESSIVK
jgi:hypothetical protein